MLGPTRTKTPATLDQFDLAPRRAKETENGRDYPNLNKAINEELYMNISQKESMTSGSRKSDCYQNQMPGMAYYLCHN